MIIPTVARFRRTFFAGVFAQLLSLLALAVLPGAAFAKDGDALRAFDLPPGDAAQTLKQYARQAQREIVFSAEAVGRVRTNPVQGQLTPRDALDRLLADTGLVATQDAKSGAIAVKQAPPAPPEKNAPSRRANSDAAAEPAKPASRVENGVLQLETVEVTGSRIRSLLGEQGINPVLTYTREEIERSGVASLADLRDLIPQLGVGSVTAFSGLTNGTAPDGRMVVNMRGITGANTLVLVDGRRLPKTGQRGLVEAYELTGLPLSAIERVEVLLDGGSAVYGSDAVAGVINIITRKNYSGTELEFTIDNTFDTDAAFIRGAINSSLQSGKFSLRASVAYETQNALRRTDRWWLASDDRRYLGGTDGRSTLYVGGTVRAVSGTLPGTNGATVLRIPFKSDGRNLTVADFVNAGAPTDAERYDSAQTQNAVNEFDRRNLTLFSDYEFRPWLKVSLRGMFSRYMSYGTSGPMSVSTATSGNPLFTTTLPANYPGNPFGVPINVQKYLWELGDVERVYRYDNYSLTLAAGGKLAGNWRYDAGISWTQSVPKDLTPTLGFDPSRFAAAIQGANPPILLNDSLAYGAANPEGTFESLFLDQSNSEKPETWTYDFKADGPVYQWWGGEIGLAVGGEVREEYIAFNRQNFAAATESAAPATHRTIQAAFAETNLPLVSPANKVPFVHQLYVSGAIRYDTYNDFGEASKPRSGVGYKPFKWLMLRGTIGDAYKVPSLIDLTRPTNRQSQTFAATGSFVLFDTYRNEQVLGPVVNVTGGNPNLLPEESRNETWGVLFEPPVKFLKGLSFGVNHSDIKILNRVGSVTYQERLAFRPDMFVRAAATAADTAAGIPGRITEVDNRSINIAYFRSSAYDFQMRYSRQFARLGNFDLQANVTKQDKYEAIPRPGLPPTTTTNNILRPLRGVAQLDWNKWGFGLGTTAVYQDGYRTVATSANTATSSTLLWHARASYNFDHGRLHPRGGRFGRWTQGTRLNLSVQNALDEEPSFTPTGTASGAIDPRLRRYIISVRKTL